MTKSMIFFYKYYIIEFYDKKYKKKLIAFIMDLCGNHSFFRTPMKKACRRPSDWRVRPPNRRPNGGQNASCSWGPPSVRGWPVGIRHCLDTLHNCRYCQDGSWRQMKALRAPRPLDPSGQDAGDPRPARGLTKVEEGRSRASEIKDIFNKTKN